MGPTYKGHQPAMLGDVVLGTLDGLSEPVIGIVVWIKLFAPTGNLQVARLVPLLVPQDERRICDAAVDDSPQVVRATVDYATASQFTLIHRGA